MASGLDNWKMPRVRWNKVYKAKLGCFSVVSDQSVICFEDTVAVENGNLNLQLLLQSAFKEALSERSNKLKQRLDHCYLHMGLVQLGVKPLVPQAAEDTILMCLRDARLLNFRQSILGMVESDLKNGPVHFDCYPNYMISFSDLNLTRALTVNLMSKANGSKATNAVEPIELSYRVVCKILTRTHGEKALKESTGGKTKMYQANIRLNTVVSKEVKWDDVEIPQSLIEDGKKEPEALGETKVW